MEIQIWQNNSSAYARKKQYGKYSGSLKAPVQQYGNHKSGA